MMDQILQGLYTRYVAICIDDINVYSPSLKQNQKDLEDVFGWLEAVSLWASVSNSCIAQELILVLGHRVSASGIELNHHKVLAILKLHDPTNVLETKRFMEIIGFYQCFVPGAPLLESPYLSSVGMERNSDGL